MFQDEFVTSVEFNAGFPVYTLRIQLDTKATFRP